MFSAIIMFDSSAALCAIVIVFIVFGAFRYFFSLSADAGRSSFPGPMPLPVVGHALQVPAVKTWKYFERLCWVYGSLRSVLSVVMLVIGYGTDVIAGTFFSQDLYSNFRSAVIKWSS